MVKYKVKEDENIVYTAYIDRHIIKLIEISICAIEKFYSTYCYFYNTFFYDINIKLTSIVLYYYFVTNVCQYDD